MMMVSHHFGVLRLKTRIHTMFHGYDFYKSALQHLSNVSSIYYMCVHW